MKLHNLAWGLYPRRVTIYLAEKDIHHVELLDLDAVGQAWPPAHLRKLSPSGTAPILEVGDGTVIRQSVAILEYLEERFPEPNLLGRTLAERAATRELMGVVDEASTYFGLWCHKGSPLFAGREPQSREAAAIAAEAYFAKLRLLDTLADEAPFLLGERPTLADCMAMALLQFAKGLYGVALPADCPKLVGWYERFSQRPSARVAEYPPEILRLAYGLKAGA
ncbi:MAG: glutathione S-transferase family protein [Cystobacter sp.]